MSTDRYHELKARQRAEQLRHPDGMALRVHRALSWLQRAELADDDEDARFLFLWIAFKAAYAEHSLVERDFTESPALRQFLAHLLRLDEGEQLARLLWRQFPQAVRLLLDSPHSFQPYWDAHAQGQIAALSPDEIAATLEAGVRARPHPGTRRPGATRHRGCADTRAVTSACATDPAAAWRHHLGQSQQPGHGA